MTERLQVYRCEVCGNIVEVLHAGKGELVCCKQPMKLLVEGSVDAAQEKHVPVVKKTATGVKVKVGSVPHPMEEEHFFPAAAQALSEQDWDEIDFKLFDSSDPLFDAAAHARFHGLRERINKLARSSHRRTARLRQLRQLGKLTTVEEFNAFLEAAHYAYRLETRSEGGYTVVGGSRPLVDIPICTVSQAIWCAYFFVQGLEEDPA